MTHASTTPLDLDDLEQTLRGRIDELADRRQELSLDALTKSSAKTELAAVEKKLAAAEGELSRLSLARTERERRGAVQEAQEAAEARAAALARAFALQPEREAATAAVDAAARQFAGAIAAYERACQAQQAELRAAGREQEAVHALRAIGHAILPALVAALRQESITRGLFAHSLPHLAVSRVRPLAAADRGLVQPEGA